MLNMIRRGDRGRGTRNEFDAEPAVPLRGREFFFFVRSNGCRRRMLSLAEIVLVCARGARPVGQTVRGTISAFGVPLMPQLST